MLARVLKDPEVRKQEILDTAMKLFHEKGYDSTSIADIAKAMNVVPGLCYRYFTSKQEIFDTAIKQYAIESCQDFLQVIHDKSKSFKDRLSLFGKIMIHKEDNSKHHGFFHTAGNETFHLQLGIEMFKYLAPHISNELTELNKKGEISVESPELMTNFLLYGQVILWLPPHDDPHSKQFQQKLIQLRQYIYKLVGIQE